MLLEGQTISMYINMTLIYEFIVSGFGLFVACQLLWLSMAMYLILVWLFSRLHFLTYTKRNFLLTTNIFQKNILVRKVNLDDLVTRLLLWKFSRFTHHYNKSSQLCSVFCAVLVQTKDNTRLNTTITHSIQSEVGILSNAT